MRDKPQGFRILLIEDNIKRINIFKQWVGRYTLLSIVSSAGAAMGMLRRDNNNRNGRVYSGILLDHDLQEQAITVSDLSLSSTNLIDLIIENIENNVPILMHSMNEVQSITMKKRLEAAGFEVTQIPMQKLEKQAFDDWLKYCYELWEEIEEPPVSWKKPPKKSN
ncbi:MAG: hypothetical protein HQK65_01940 [Desulfamplus sp.]|nr:hypothetical protein [Desulfamplus sp.]